MFTLIAGPGTAESPEQMLTTARCVAEALAHALGPAPSLAAA